MFYPYKYRSLVIFLILSAACRVEAQEPRRQVQLETEQLLNYFRSRKNPSLQTTQSIGIVNDGKCGFRVGGQLLDRWDRLSQAQQAEMSILMQPGAMQCDTVAGHFRIFYDTSGINMPSLIDIFNNPIPGTAKAYIDSVVNIFNYVWAVEVDQMGYTAPPFEAGQSYYNVYVTERYGSNYGETVRIFPSMNGNAPYLYRSYIEIDNDYMEFPTGGINGLKVTAAHEFHHSIQIGAYGEWPEDLYAYEITSTWFEDVVYTEVNDYYNYLSWYFGDQFRSPGYWQGWSFNSSDRGGYERCIWAHYLAKRFNPSIMRDVWNAMRSQRFLPSTEVVLSDWGSTLQSAFAEFTYWNFFTKYRANPEKYYPEGENYPLFQPLRQTPFSNGTSTVNGIVFALSSSIYEFDMAQDTLNIIVANIDGEDAKNGKYNPRGIDITLSTQSIPQPFTNLANGLKAKVSVSDDLSLWRYFFSQETIRADAAPNPFQLAVAQRLLLPVNEDRSQTAEVYFYTSSLSLACSGSFNIIYEYSTRVIVVPTNEVRSKLSSGIYFVIARTANHDYKWKIAVIR